MRAAAWSANRTIVLDERPEPEPGPGELLIRVAACGICGSDLHQYHGATPAIPGMVPGHEITGVVAGGEGLAVGTPVAVEPLLTCGSCEACRAGRAPVCSRRVLLGMARPGGMQEFITVPARHVFPLPPGVSLVAGSMAEPLAVCVRGVNLASVAAGSRVLVLGSGTIGLLTLLLLRGVAAEITMTARYDHQADLASKLGASGLLAAAGEAVRHFARSTPPDVVIETVGGPGETLVEALETVRPGGRVVALGVFSGRPAIPAARLVVDEVTLVGSLMYGNPGGRSEFGAAVALLPRYDREIGLLQTHRFPLADCAEAFATAGAKQTGAIKVTVTTAGAA